MGNKRFAEIFEKGRIAVIEATYFANCLSNHQPFQDRKNIPPEYCISGDILQGQLNQHGAKFLVIFYYAWLTAEHPDPICFTCVALSEY